MKKLTFAFVIFATAFFILNAVTLQAQTVVLTDEFNSGDGLWNSGWIDNTTTTVTVSIDTTSKLSGKNSYKLVIVNGGADMYRVQRNANLALLPGMKYTLSFMAVADSNASINALFELAGDPYTKVLNDTARVTTTPQTFTYTMTSSAAIPTNMVKLHFGSHSNDRRTIWVDNIKVTSETDPALVTQWGKTVRGTAWPILNTSSTAAGDASMGGIALKAWATISGGFSTIALNTGETFVVRGQLEYVGADPGAAYTGLRYALSWQDSASLNYQNTDSAMWVSTKGHYGYQFTPRSGGADVANGTNGSGTTWTLNGVAGWNSTYNAAITPFGTTVLQAPRLAVLVKGVYNFAISVQAINDTTNEVRWYLAEQNNKYWFGGTSIDNKRITSKFNFISFGTNSDINAGVTHFKLAGVTAQKGTPITIPEAPWQAFYVDKWGATARGAAWPVNNDTTYLVGDASMGGKALTGWATISGGFGDAISLTTGKALIVSGQLEYVGADPGAAYTGLRYALSWQDSSKLNNQYKDSALWVSTKGHYGYQFTPRSGGADVANGTNGSGTSWSLNGVAGWNSTYNAAITPIGSTVLQAPRLAVLVKGIYDFAISVQAINDTTNEVRWYLVEKNKKYWFGGTSIDNKRVASKFNFISFGTNSDINAGVTNLKLYAVKVDKGTPITIPEAPWQAFYVDKWGATARGAAWPVNNDTTYLVGDASMGGKALTGWATISGGFGDAVSLTTGKALIVSGQLEYVGADPGAAYTGLRYALSWQDSSKLNNQYKDSALWVSTKGHYGYQFTPRSGGADVANGTNGSGTSWSLNGVAGWNSTYNAAITPIGSTVLQAPRLAVLVKGIYDFAISVQAINDTTNEVRWYLVEKNKKYWFGGTSIDNKRVASKFNFISFGTNSDINAGVTNLKLYAVKVDKGTPITIPEAPWQAFYVDKWGATARGAAWPVNNDTTYLVGDASMGGKALTGWATISGGFGDAISLTTGKALIVSGQLEYVGADPGAAYTGLRYALSWQDSSKLNNQYKDSALWVSTKGHYGYQFTPRSGGADVANGTNGSGTSWSLNGVAGWNSTYNAAITPIGSTVLQVPRLAVLVKGIYDFAISVQAINDTTNEVRWYLIEKNKKYWFGGTSIDNKRVASKFNFISFGTNSDINAGVTNLKLYAVKVDKGTPIIVPPAPWQKYYVSDWGVIGNRFSGWKFMPDPDGFVGNAGIGGTAANTSWTAMRGGFDPFNLADGSGLLITGKVELVGGGFDAKSSLRVGVYYTEAAGKLVDSASTLTKRVPNVDSTRWNGTETGVGYLFIPQSGTNAQDTWADSKVGNWGAVVNRPWLLTDGIGNTMIGDIPQMPAKAVGGAGVYSFAFSVVHKSDGNNDVKFTLFKTGYTYVATASGAAPLVTSKFNSIAFALNTNASTTALKVTDVLVDTTSKPVPVSVKASEGSPIPTVYALGQNYPNPFNPTTTIQYDLPMSSHVTLSIYDMLGREVTRLVDQAQSASRYTVQWNATNLSSGVYFYRINARGQDGSKNFTSVKKLMLMK